MAEYNKTAQVVAQVNQLKTLMADGRTMTADEIKVALGRKWITSVVYYLGEEVNLEQIKDGKKILGYRIAGMAPVNSVQTTVMPKPQIPHQEIQREAAAASVSSVIRKKAAAQIQQFEEKAVPTVDMKAIVEKKEYVESDEMKALKAKVGEPCILPDGTDLTIPTFLIRR